MFDEDTCTRVEVDFNFGLAFIESLFFGKPLSPKEELHQGKPIGELFIDVEPDPNAGSVPVPRGHPTQLPSEKSLVAYTIRHLIALTSLLATPMRALRQMFGIRI